MQALLLAAGFGTRLRPYTLIRPKPLFPVLNKPLLEILLARLFDAGCKRIVVNAHHLAEQIEKAICGRSQVVLQYEPEILGTGGSLRKALPLFEDEPVLIMNGDIYNDVDLCALVESHKRLSYPVTMAMHDYPRFNGVEVDNTRVVSFGKRKSDSRNPLLAFTGIHVVDNTVIERIPQTGFFHIINLYAELAVQSQVGCVRVDDSFWHDIGTPKDYLDLHRELLVGQRKIDASSPWCISSRAEVASNVHLKDWGVIGTGAVVSSGAVLSRCIVWPGARVEPGQHLTDVIVT
jgi:mannose-1-phosphate guanylyltransferase